MKIAVDAMGGDFAPEQPVKAAVMAAEDLGAEILLFGDERLLTSALAREGYKGDKIKVCHAGEVITAEDSPARAVKQKQDSSMVMALKSVRDGAADAVVSAGNTGALMAGSIFFIKRIRGIVRPALAAIIPTQKSAALLIDAGANTDSKPQSLLQFAKMGALYCEKVMHVRKPRVGLVSNGSEEVKGDELTRAAHLLIKDGGVNFAGNMEAREIPLGAADVIVCDGFVGNVILKLMEGMGIAMFGSLREAFEKNALTRLGALLTRPGLRSFKHKMDYSEYGGAPLLGLNGVVVKAHGSSRAKSLYYTIRQAMALSETKIILKIKESIKGGDDD